MIQYKRSGSVAVLLLSIILCFGQKSVYQSYSWAEHPEMHIITQNNSSYAAVVIEHQRMLELVIGQNPTSYFTEHKIIHINSDAGIEKQNKVAIPMHNGRQLIDLKVRAISPDGKVTNFRRENLKELQNVDGYRNFKIFAIEGVTVGGEVEYIYTVRSNPQSYGREVIQQDVPVLEAGFIIVHPKRIGFEMKVYNKNIIPKSSSYDDARNSIVISASNIQALNNEQYSNYRTNLVRVDYRMREQGSSFSWHTIGERLLKSSTDPGGVSKVSKLIKLLNANDQSYEGKILALERYVKANFTLKDGNNDEYENLKDVVSNRIGNERGLLKLYTSCLQALGVSYYLVFGSNRNEGKLDQAFATPLDIREVLIYFPSLKKYLSPGITYMRLGAAPDAIAESDALFVPGNSSSMPTFDTIKPLGYELNTMGVKAIITLQDGVATISQENSWQGTRGALYRGIYYIQKDAQRDEFIKDVTLSSIDNFKVLKREIEGEDLTNSENPANFFRIKTTYTAPSLVQQAGDDYIISIGKVIGIQAELYQEHERQSDIAFQATSNYEHEIIMEIPPGFKCTGFDAAKIDRKVVLDDNPVMFFKSGYKLEDNKVILSVNEVYKILTLPKEKYEDFRGVVNSASDFNKLTLVLTKN